MVTVSGRLLDFVEDPSQVAQVQVRAREVRPHGDGVMLDHPVNVEWDPPTGTVTFDAAAGTAGVIMWHAVGRSHASGSLPIVVPEGDTATLAECVRNAEMAGDRDVGELAGILEQIRGSVGASAEARAGAEAAAADAAGSAASAGRDADRAETAAGEAATEAAGLAADAVRLEVKGDADRSAAGATTATASAAEAAADRERTGRDVVAAEGYASAAADSASEARGHERNASASAVSAGESEQAAAQHAADTKADSGRALEAADRIGTAEQVGVWHGETLEARDEAESARDVAVDAAEQATTGVPDGAVTRVKLAPEVREELDGKAAAEHKHVISDVTGLQAAIDDAAGAATWEDLDGKPSEFPPSTHTHAFTDLTGVPDVATKGYVATEVAKKADKAHTHTAADVGARPDTWTPTAAQVGAATPTYVDSRIQLVTSWPSSPVAGVLYLMEED